MTLWLKFAYIYIFAVVSAVWQCNEPKPGHMLRTVYYLWVTVQSCCRLFTLQHVSWMTVVNPEVNRSHRCMCLG